LWRLLQLTLLALLFLGEMVAYGATGDRTDDTMVTRQVTRDGTHRGTLEAAACLDLV
jgi:hypothetical protein